MGEDTRPDAADKAADVRGDEFFEFATQNNANNAKRTYDEFQDVSLASARRSQSHHDDLNSRTLNSFDSLLGLQAKINEEHFASIHELRKHLANIQTDRQRHADVWAYETAYDLGNPMTTGPGDNIRAGGVTANRIVDTTGAVAGAGTAVSAEAVAAAVAKSVDATITPVLGMLQQMLSTIASMNASMANVIAQVQPKTA